MISEKRKLCLKNNFTNIIAIILVRKFSLAKDKQTNFIFNPRSEKASSLYRYWIIYLYIMYFIFFHFLCFWWNVKFQTIWPTVYHMVTARFRRIRKYRAPLLHLRHNIAPVLRWMKRARGCSDRSSCLCDIFKLSKWGILRYPTARGFFFLKL